MLKAILFDLDGTLIDSEHFHFDCWNEVLHDYGIELSYNDWVQNYAGIPMPSNAACLIKKYQLTVSHGELVNKREQLTLNRLKTSGVSLMPFAVEALNFFSAAKLTIALVTSSPKQDVEAIFERNGLGRFFTQIITRTDVKNSKPDPESYLLCMEKLSLSKHECLAFEDTINGVRAAKAAGISCYAVQNNQAEHGRLQIADQVFADFQEAIAFFKLHHS